MSEPGQYLAVHRLRCGVCGGRSNVIGCEDPNGDEWMCPHHGAGRSDADFTNSGLGEIGSDFEYLGMVVVRPDTTRHIDESVDVLEQDVETVEQVRFSDYEAVDIRGMSNKERAHERGVSESTIRQSRMDAKRALFGGDDE